MSTTDIFMTAFNDLLIATASGKPFTNDQVLPDDSREVLTDKDGICGVGHDFQRPLVLHVLDDETAIKTTAELRVIRMHRDGVISLFLRCKLTWINPSGGEHIAYGKIELSDETARHLFENASDHDSGDTDTEGFEFIDFTGADFLEELANLEQIPGLDEMDEVAKLAEQYKASWMHILPDMNSDSVRLHQRIVTAAMDQEPDMLALLLDYRDDLEDVLQIATVMGTTQMPGAADPNDVFRIRNFVHEELRSVTTAPAAKTTD